MGADPTSIGVLFDCDGVLADTFEANLAAYREALREVEGTDRALTREVYAAVWGKSWRDWLPGLCADADAVHDAKIRCYPDLLAGHAAPLPGWRSLLEHRRRGHPVAITSNASSDSVRGVFRMLCRGGETVDDLPVLTPTASRPGKPSPAMLLEACARLGVDRAVLLDDDGEGAARAARDAGVAFIHVTEDADRWQARLASLLDGGRLGTRGVVVAAGEGRRLGAVCGPFAKPLVEVAGRPVVAHATASLCGSVGRIVAVVAPRTGGDVTRTVRRAAEATPDHIIAVERVVQPHPDGVADALRRAVDRLPLDGPLIMVCGDNVVDPCDVEAVVASVTGVCRAGDPSPVAMAWTYRVRPESDARRFAVLDPVRRVLVEKPEQPPSGICWCGPVAFRSTRMVAEALAHQRPSARGELEMVDLMNYFMRRTHTEPVALRGRWFDIGTVAALEEARRVLTRPPAVPVPPAVPETLP